MTRLVVSIRDVKVGEYMSLVVVKNVGEAERAFQNLCMEPRSPLHRFPRDYQMHQVGTFNPESGEISGISVKDVTPYSWIDEKEAERVHAGV